MYARGYRSNRLGRRDLKWSTALTRHPAYYTRGIVVFFVIIMNHSLFQNVLTFFLNNIGI